MLIEQTKIAREKLGISMKAFKKILIAAHIEEEFKLINNKRHYDFDRILEVLKRGK